MVKSKVLSDAGWKDVAGKSKVKDNGLLKALEKRSAASCGFKAGLCDTGVVAKYVAR
jgi:hypothetical protein